MGGGPSASTTSPAELVNAILGGFKRELPQYRNFIGAEPLIQQGQTAAARMGNLLTGYAGPVIQAGGATPFTRALTNYGQGVVAARGATPFTSALLNYATPIVRRGGAFTPQQQQQQLNDMRAAMSGSGMLRTAPGAFQQGMNLYNLEQENLRTAAGLGQAGTGLQQNILSTGAGLGQTGTQLQQGILTNAANLMGMGVQAPLGAEQAGIGDYTGLLGVLSGAVAQQVALNQQAQNQANIAGANKTAGLESGALSALGTVAGAAAMSDERLKTNIIETGKIVAGIPEIEFEYKSKRGKRYRGFAAQDVEKRFPEEIVAFAGYKYVRQGRFSPVPV